MGRRFSFGLVMVLFFQGAISVMAQEKPNVLVLFTDDLGYHDLSGHGSKIYQTPNIDRLEKEGVSFHQAYSNYPRCVPSRYALMSGNYPIKNNGVPESGFDMSEIPVEDNLVSQFKKEGYHTAYFGKWHLGKGESSPEGFGFDHVIAAGKAGSPISYLYPFNTPKGNNKKVKKAPMPMNFSREIQEGEYLPDVMTEELIAYLKVQKENKEQPFFAMMAFYAVHQPLEAKKEDEERNKKQINKHDFGKGPEYVKEGTGRTKMRQDHPKYAGMVENLDMNVGRVLNFLKENGLSENTVVVFSSDHGGLSNDGTKERQLATSNAPLRAGKGWMYEGGIRVPLMLRYPELIPVKSETTSVVLLMDLLPTLLDMGSSSNINSLDGKSFFPVINGSEKWDDRTVFWHASKSRPVNTGEGVSSVVRSGDYKLIDFYEEGKIELYNIVKDPTESNNLVAKKPCKRKKLEKKLKKWKKARLE